MKKISRNELLPFKEYIQVHDRFLRRVIQEKKLRRFNLNDRMTGLFETRLTVWFQIQEMIRAEEISREEHIQEMLDVYNDLIPENHELGMTLFIEIPNQESLRAFNRQIVGIENHVEIRFDGETITSFEPDSNQAEDEHYTQSVHYLRFPFSNEQIRHFKDWDGEVTIHVNHPAFQTEATLPEDLIASLKGDLSV